MLVVVLNTITLALDGTFTDQSTINMLSTANLVFTIIFATEMGFKLIAFGPIGICMQPFYKSSEPKSLLTRLCPRHYEYF